MSGSPLYNSCMESTDTLERRRLVSIAEDLEYFREWWTNADRALKNVEIRHASGALRRLLVEDAAGKAWRGVGFEKSPKIKGPDLLAVCAEKKLGIAQAVTAVAGGVRYGGVDASCI